MDDLPISQEMASELMADVHRWMDRMCDAGLHPCQAADIIESAGQAIHRLVHEVQLKVAMDAMRQGEISPTDLVKLLADLTMVETHTVQITPDMSPADAEAAIMEKVSALTEEVKRSVASRLN